jgi:hypothetical protein
MVIFALSLAMVLCSVSLGLPRLLVPAGVQLKACRGSLLLSILNTCSRYFQRSPFINVETSSCFVSSLNVLFDLNYFQCVRDTITTETMLFRVVYWFILCCFALCIGLFYVVIDVPCVYMAC